MFFMFPNLLTLIVGIALGAFCWHKAKKLGQSAGATDDTRANFTKRFFGYLLMTIGVTLTILCGGCTLIFFGFEAYDEFISQVSYGEDYVDFYAIAFIGGIPTIIAIVLFFLGRFLKKWGMGKEPVPKA